MTTKAYCPANCGRRFVSKEHANAHADKDHTGWNDPNSVKRKGWVTPYGFADFKEPVTFAEACKTMRSVIEALEDRHSKRHPTRDRDNE